MMQNYCYYCKIICTEGQSTPYENGGITVQSPQISEAYHSVVSGMLTPIGDAAAQPYNSALLLSSNPSQHVAPVLYAQCSGADTAPQN